MEFLQWIILRDRDTSKLKSEKQVRQRADVILWNAERQIEQLDSMLEKKHLRLEEAKDILDDLLYLKKATELFMITDFDDRVLKLIQRLRNMEPE